MGAGVSIASNTASAVASAYTNVVNNTNVLQNQSVVQSQSVTLENCDINSKQSNNISMSANLKQSMQQIANVENDTTIANSIAQALAQAATSSVGVGVIGIADSNNTASTYANMSTNVSNYVKFSSKQSSSANQSFTCQNSTIVSSDGGFNLSMQETGDVSQYQADNVMNQTKVSNTITQTIKQTATASTGMSWWVVLAIAIVAIVGGIIFKLKDAKSKATRAIDMQQAIELGCCTRASLNISNISGGLNPRSGACAGCDCYKLAHPEAHISKATVVIYFVGMLLIGGLIGLWYAFAMGRGCLFDDACGDNGGSNFNGMMAGCSCQFELDGDGDQVCKDSLHAHFSSNGLPLKYQYPLFIKNQVNDSGGCTASRRVGAASMQGILVQALATISPTTNSNNGKNMDTINNYFCFMAAPKEINYVGQSCTGSSASMSTPLQYMYLAAVDYICKNKDNGYELLFDAIQPSDSESTDTSCSPTGNTPKYEMAYRLYAFLCPLRPVLCNNAPQNGADAQPLPLINGSWPDTTALTNDIKKMEKTFTQDPLGTGNLQWVVASQITDPDTTMAVMVPPAFRYGTGGGQSKPKTTDPSDNNDAWNSDAGCCSLHTMKYMAAKDDHTMRFSCGCFNPDDPNQTDGDPSTAMTFCSGGQGRCGSDTNCIGGADDGQPCSTGCNSTGNFTYGSTAETAMQLPVYGSAAASDSGAKQPCGGNTESQFYTSLATIEANTDKNPWLAYYAEWTDFADNISDKSGDAMGPKLCSLIRLLWAGTLSYVKGTSSDTIYGTNALLKTVATNAVTDHYYVANVKNGVPWGKIGDSDDTTGQINDSSLLNIKLVEDVAYSAMKGFSQAGCNANATAIKGQGYTASAQKLGYCRSQFFNRITLYTMIGLLIFWVLTLPVFLILRLYVNKGTSSRYLAAANAQGRKRKRTRVAQDNTPTPSLTKETTESAEEQAPSPANEEASLGSFDNGAGGSGGADYGQQGMELGQASDKMKRQSENQRLNEEDMQVVQESPGPVPQPSPEPKSEPERQTHNGEGESLDPLMGIVPSQMKGGKRKRGRK